MLAGNFLVGETDMNPYNLVYPPYITIDPYNETFREFQRRFLDPKFGEWIFVELDLTAPFNSLIRHFLDIGSTSTSTELLEVFLIDYSIQIQYINFISWDSHQMASQPGGSFFFFLRIQSVIWFIFSKSFFRWSLALVLTCGDWFFLICFVLVCFGDFFGTIHDRDRWCATDMIRLLDLERSTWWWCEWR